MGLFVIVGELEKAETIEWLAGEVLKLTDNMVLLSICILWGSAFYLRFSTISLSSRR